MTTTYLKLTPRDPIIARDGRPFGAGQGNRMRGLPWLLPSVVAGSLRTALVKASDGLDFNGDMPQKLMNVEVAGVFPSVKTSENKSELYLPAPNDAVAEPTEDRKAIKQVFRATPQQTFGGCDFPDDLPLRPVMLSEDQGTDEDFKPMPAPEWWPLKRYVEWLTLLEPQRPGDWFNNCFLKAAIQETRDHVVIDEHTGANKDGHLFSTTGLNLTHLPKFHNGPPDKKSPFGDRFAKIELSARVDWKDSKFEHLKTFDTWHPLGGERRLVHWRTANDESLWDCPKEIKTVLENAECVRMVLATPAIFDGGWKPGWLNDQLEGPPPGTNIKLKLVGVSNGRWKAVSGWSLQPIPDPEKPHKEWKPGPKKIRRMVPAGSVYFFTCEKGHAAKLEKRWLQSVSDKSEEQEPRHFASAQADGFGLAVWGTW